MSINSLETRSKQGQNDPGSPHSVRNAAIPYEIDLSETPADNDDF